MDFMQASPAPLPAAAAAHHTRSGAGMAVIVKSGIDLVTETDRKCEDIILGMLRTAFPDHCFVGEESTFETGEDERVRSLFVALSSSAVKIVNIFRFRKNFLCIFWCKSAPRCVFSAFLGFVGFVAGKQGKHQPGPADIYIHFQSISY